MWLGEDCRAITIGKADGSAFAYKPLLWAKWTEMNIGKNNISSSLPLFNKGELKDVEVVVIPMSLRTHKLNYTVTMNDSRVLYLKDPTLVAALRAKEAECAELRIQLDDERKKNLDLSGEDRRNKKLEKDADMDKKIRDKFRDFTPSPVGIDRGGFSDRFNR